MEKIYDSCCGIDVHKKLIVACFLHGREQEIREFGATTRELLELAAWLSDGGCQMVAMESTACYWKPLYNVLEVSEIPVIVVNAKDMKNVPGRKTDVQIYDYVDVYVPVLERMYQKRVKAYASIGYQTKSDCKNETEPNMIYDGKSYFKTYQKDIETAKKEIIIVSPFMRKNYIEMLTRILSTAKINGVNVAAITRPADDFKEKDRATVEENIEFLKSYGVKVILKSDFYQRFTIIDSKTVWYGNVNFLSFSSSNDSVMRLESEVISEGLMNTI